MDELRQFPWAPILAALFPLWILTPFLLKYAIKRFLDSIDSKPSMGEVQIVIKKELDERFTLERALYKDATIALLREYFPRPKRREP